MAETNYTYNPAEITEESVSRARFELGDIAVEGKADTCYLSDQEIQAIIATESGWKWKLFRLADAVCMRLSYEVNFKNDGTSFDMNQRAERWMRLRDKLKDEASLEECLPESGAVNDSIGSADGGHYFYRDMTSSPYVQPPYLHGGEVP